MFSPTRAAVVILFTSTLLIVSSALLIGCGDSPPSVDCNAEPAPRYSELSAMRQCRACHSSRLSGDERQGAPASVNYDTYDAAVAAASSGEEQIASGAMPPDGFPFTELQKSQFYSWAQCGTPQ